MIGDWERASNIADKRCSARYDEPFTDEIANLRKEKRVLLKMETQIANNLDMSQALEEEMKRGIPFTIQPIREERSIRVREIRKIIKEKANEVWQIRKGELKEKMEAKKKSKDRKGAKALQKIIAAEENAEV